MVEPAAPPADTKDWTWVLQRPCPQCGFDSRSVRREDVPGLLRDQVSQWAAMLRRADVRERPAPQVWSALEYGCHVRDVYRVFEQRLRLMRSVDDPLFDSWDQDATALEQRYHAQDPAEVSAELAQAGRGLAAAFAEVVDEG